MRNVYVAAEETSERHDTKEEKHSETRHFNTKSEEHSSQNFEMKQTNFNQYAASLLTFQVIFNSK